MVTGMEADQTATKVCELEAMLVEERKNVAYWKEIAEMMRLRAQALSEEVELLK